jgi:urease accessory protein
VRATRVELTGTPDRPGVELVAGAWAPRVVSRAGHEVRVALVATTATLLGGDRTRLEVVVGAGLRLDLLDVAATVAYHGRGRQAHVEVSLRVERGATLVWAAEPLVVCEGAHVLRALSLDVAADGRALVRDTLRLGRVDERGGRLSCETRVSCDRRPALVESLELGSGDLGDTVDRGDGRGLPGVVGAARVLDSVLAVGWRPQPPELGDTMRLEQEGALFRHLGSDAHDSPAGSVLGAWRAELARPSRGLRRPVKAAPLPDPG